MDGEQELNYKCNLSEELQKIAKDELREDEKIREQLLEQFRHWIKKHPSIKNCRTDSVFLLMFLRAKKFSLPAAQQVLEKYISTRKIYRDWFQNLINDPNVEAIIDNGYMVPLLKPDKNGRKVILFNVGRFDPYKFTSCDMLRIQNLVLETLLEDEENQVRGFTYIMDESKVTMAHISFWSILDIRNSVHYLQNAIPIRHKNIFIVNVPTYAVKFLEFCTSLLSKKLRERCTIHKNINELKDVIDLKSLPTELGGEVPLTEMIDSLKNKVKMKKEQINILDNMDIDITSVHSQPSNNKQMEGISGSFRKLEVD